MPLVSMRQLLDHAAENGYGTPGIQREQPGASAGDHGGGRTRSTRPVIMQASAGARKYAGEAFLRHLIEAAVESYPHIPVVMHQDHGQSPAVCMAAIRSGFTSVMMDGSLEADGKSVASYEYNVDVSRKVVEMAHSIGVTVEAELGVLGSLETMKGDKEDGHGAEGTMTREQLLTDVEQAADFVKLTQCDALAIAIGTSHGAYKFTQEADRRHPRHPAHQGNPPAHPEHAPRDARFVVGAAGPACRDPRIRRRHEGNLRRAGRGNPGRHQERRAQGQYRHRPASRDHRRDPPLLRARTRRSSIRATT